MVQAQMEDADAEAAIGRIISVRGSTAEVSLPRPREGTGGDGRVTVGSFLAVRVPAPPRGTGDAGLLVGMVTAVAHGAADTQTAALDLIGEIRGGGGGRGRFARGVSSYPGIDDPVTALPHDCLALIYTAGGSCPITVGSMFHDHAMPARVDADRLLDRHFAILGSTGVGKSSGVTVILRELLVARPDLRVFLIDCHSEYGRAFGPRANIVDSSTLKLPFWMFNFEEFVDVLYGGRVAVDEEVEILSELIPIAKSNYLGYKQNDRLTLKRNDPRATGFTVDTPVPYILQDLVGLLDERMGKLENRASRMNYHRLMSRIETIRNNPRYDFMFENANVGGDTMAELLTQLFRLDATDRPITVMQLAGLPVEVVDAVVCVLCRMAFDFGLWSDGAVPLLFVCEEAHRYASLDQDLGFAPTRRALSRIAKEGRKYGVYLGLVSQRPSELDPSIISQCATLFAMRMANERDQALLRSAISDATADLLAFVPSLGTREVIAFGEGVPFPARMRFTTLSDVGLLRSEAVTAGGGRSGATFIQDVVDRWRRAVTGRKLRTDDAPATPAEGEGIAATSRLDQAKLQMLRR